MEKRTDEQTKRLEAEIAGLKAQLAELEASNRAKDSWIATVSHELRTPMNVLGGWIDLLKEGDVEPEEYPGVFETLHRNFRAQCQLIDDLLDISRIITDKMRLVHESVDLGQLVEEVVKSFGLAAEDKGLTVEHVCKAPLQVDGDGDRLRQVVANLLSNAIKYSEKGGKVRVTVAADAGRARIQVRDEGRGIEPEFLPLVFERLRQAAPGAGRRQGGLGLGLAIARHIVHLHGGTITAASGGRDQGATFTVELPMPDAQV
jgi:signal transduction histidine kinase